MDGTATIRALLQIDPKLRVIATSGLAINGADRARGVKTHAFLPKPYTAEALLRTLREVIDAPVTPLSSGGPPA
jgi:hypothetical protein